MDFENLESTSEIEKSLSKKRPSKLQKKISIGSLCLCLFLTSLAGIIVYSVFIVFSKSVQIAKISKEVQELESLYNEKKQENSKVNQDYTQLKEENDGIDTTLKVKEEALKLLNKENETLFNNIETSNALLEESYSALMGLQKKNEKIKLDKKSIEEDIVETKQQIAKLDGKNTRLKKEYKELSEKYKEITGKDPDDPSTPSVSSKSKILTSKNQYIKLNQWIYPLGTISLNLLYRKSEDGFTGEIFYHKVSERREFVSYLFLIKTTDGDIFGGYSTKPMLTISGAYTNDANAFLFNMNTLKKYPIQNSHWGVMSTGTILFVFGQGDIVVSENGCHSSFPMSYNGEEGKAESLELTNGKGKFKVDELEVFTLQFDDE